MSEHIAVIANPTLGPSVLYPNWEIIDDPMTEEQIETIRSLAVFALIDSGYLKGLTRT